MRFAGSFWCVLSGQHEKACRTCWCSWPYIPLSNIVLRCYASSTSGIFILLMDNAHLSAFNWNLWIGWKRNWGEKSDSLSWSWIISCTKNQLSGNHCSFGRCWRGYFFNCSGYLLSLLNNWNILHGLCVVKNPHDTETKTKLKNWEK